MTNPSFGAVHVESMNVWRRDTYMHFPFVGAPLRPSARVICICIHSNELCWSRAKVLGTLVPRLIAIQVPGPGGPGREHGVEAEVILMLNSFNVHCSKFHKCDQAGPINVHYTLVFDHSERGTMTCDEGGV